jgi:hypothetical protein
MLLLLLLLADIFSCRRPGKLAVEETPRCDNGPEFTAEAP